MAATGRLYVYRYAVIKQQGFMRAPKIMKPQEVDLPRPQSR